MLLRAIFILTVAIACITSDLQCLNCIQTLNLKSSETIDTTKPKCDLVDAKYSSCSQLLQVRYSEEKASVRFETNPVESLVLSNAAQIMTNTTLIWLNKVQIERIFEIFCFNNNACKADAINNIYHEGEL
jgi:hypothetical protein